MSEHICKLENVSDTKHSCDKCLGAGTNSCQCVRHDEDECNAKIVLENNKTIDITLHKNPTFLDIANKCDRRLPQIGDVYVHFKGMKVYVVDLAYHTETNEPLIIYRHEDTSWARPLEMFLSKVDTIKYPDTKQKYRLERELPWNITTTIEFKDMVEEMFHIDRFKSYTQEEMEQYVLEHYYL